MGCSFNSILAAEAVLVVRYLPLGLFFSPPLSHFQEENKTSKSQDEHLARRADAFVSYKYQLSQNTSLFLFLQIHIHIYQ